VELKRISRAHVGAVTCVDLDTYRVYSGGVDKSVNIFSTATTVANDDNGNADHTSDGGSSVVIDSSNHNDDQGVMRAPARAAVPASRSSRQSNMSSPTGSERPLAYMRHASEVMCLRTAKERVITGCKDGKVRVWSVSTGQCT
jgi:WD40 repeat protein